MVPSAGGARRWEAGMIRDKYRRPAFLDQPRQGGERLTTSAMIASIAGPDLPTRAAPFGHAPTELAKSRPDIVGLTADLAKYTDLHVLAKAFPERFFEIAWRSNCDGCRCGNARQWFTPFVTTHAVFATRWAYDFICMAIAEEMLPVKIVCALPGVTTGYGPSHQATEDLAIFRGMPNLTIIGACDASDIE